MSSPEEMAAVMAALPPGYLEERQGPAQRAGMIACMVVTILIVGSRVYARVGFIQSFGWDDILMVVAAVLSLTVGALSIYIVDLGAGKHMLAVLANDDIIKLSKYLVGAQILYMFALWTIRLSGLAFYVRLSKGLNRFDYWIYGAFAFVTATMLVQVSLVAFQCVPLAKLWNSQLPGTCLEAKAVFLPTAASTVVCDSVILLLPLAIVLSLKTTVKRKIVLGVIMCFGVFALITSIFRITSMIPAVRKGQKDPMWYYADILVWGSAETTSAILALSIPALKPLFGSIFSDGSANRSSAGGNSSGNGKSGQSHRMQGMNSDGLKAVNTRTESHALKVVQGPGANDSEEHLWVTTTEVAAVNGKLMR